MHEVVCDRVGKIYQTGRTEYEALRDVNFTVEAGEFVTLLGPSGCGKSTLLMMLGGLEQPTQGAVLAGGTPITKPRPDIGFMFQEATLLPWKTALQNVLFPIDMMRWPRARYVERAQGLLRRVGLGEIAGKRPSQMSGGMRQRVSLCRALVSDPAILLMDEPFSALDAITRDDMNMALLEVWEAERKTVLFVTHSIREAVLLSSRILVMGGKPAGIIGDVAVPFPHPRDFALTETTEFNRLCRQLREQITQAHGA